MKRVSVNPRCYYFSGTEGGGVNIVFGGVLGSGGGDIQAFAIESGILVVSDVVVNSICNIHTERRKSQDGIISCYILTK